MLPSPLALSFLLFEFATVVWALWPLPKAYQHGSTVVWMSPDVQYVYKPRKSLSSGIQQIWETLQHQVLPPQRYECGLQIEEMSIENLVAEAFERMKSIPAKHRFIPWKFHPRRSEFEPDVESTVARVIRAVEFEKVNEIRITDQKRVQKSEAYTIWISEDGDAKITFICPQGALYALQTFSQLFYAHGQSSSGTYTPYAPLNIVDGPVFEHRGLNLDIARNWIPPEDVMRTITAMSTNKLNRLHIHAVDAQSWPIEVPALPELALEGAYDPSQIWTTRDLEEVQHHGLMHGVEVFLEIDMPGHSTAIAHAYPDLITAANEDPWSTYALEPPSGQLKLNSTNVSHFVKTLLHDLMQRSSRWSSKFHIGGDELNLIAYTLEPTVNSSSFDILKPLLQSFVDLEISIAQSYFLTPIVWEELLVEWNLKLPNSVIVQTWRAGTDLANVTAKGHKALFGSYSHWYLDCGHGSFLDPNILNPNLSDPNRAVKPPHTDYCSPYKNWRMVYSYDPLANMSESQKHLVLGGEASLWAELTDSVTMDGMLWPRLSAAAEVLWSGTGKLPDESTTRRLAEMRERLVLSGVSADWLGCHLFPILSSIINQSVGIICAWLVTRPGFNDVINLDKVMRGSSSGKNGTDKSKSCMRIGAFPLSKPKQMHSDASMENGSFDEGMVKFIG